MHFIGQSWFSPCGLLISVLLGALMVSHAVNLPMADQIEAVQGLLERLLPDHAALFRLYIHGEASEGVAACFEVSIDPTGTIHVEGTSGVGLSILTFAPCYVSYLISNHFNH